MEAATGLSGGSRALSRDGDFLRLWSGETISLFGTQVTVLALPLTAVLTLDASAGQLGLLNAARFAPFIAVILFAGVWVDRRRRRPILIQTNVGRALLVGAIPAAAVFELLRMEVLYAVGFLVGVLTVFFDLAYQSYLPSLVGRAQLTAANSRLEASRSAAEVGGPGIGGLLVQVASAPYALLVDAVSFLVSGALLSSIRHEEAPPPPAADDREGVLRAIRGGFRLTFANRYLRPIAGEAATFNLFEQAIMTVFVLYAVRELGLTAGLLGLIISVGAAGAFVGAVAAPYPARRWGLGPTIVSAMAIACTVPLALPAVDGAPATAVPLLAATFFVWGLAVAISNVHVVSLRQAATPDHLLGRVNASYRFFTYGAIPIGALFGGFLGEAIGLRATLLVSALGLLLALLWVIASAVARLSELPARPDAVAARASGNRPLER
ncbi:MAG TPA: MFS transporter [Gaiellaceae bacterium]|nr:MFS transporter [Gaiellaceae bacterium]